jgi:hypothetical protein
VFRQVFHAHGFFRKLGGWTLAQKLRGAEPAEQQLRVGKPEEGLKPGF